MFLSIFLNKKIFIATRIVIYSAAFFILLLAVYLNVFRIEIKTLLLQDENAPVWNFYEIPSYRPASEVVIQIILADPNVDLSKLQMKISRNHLVLLRKNNTMIDSAEKLKGLLIEETLPNYPTGSLISFDHHVFLIRNKTARRIETDSVFDTFGFNRKKIKSISKENFSMLEIGGKIVRDNLLEDGFPGGIIIKSGEKYYLTGEKRIYPIFSEDLIKEVWPDFNYIEVESISESEMQEMHCYKISSEKAECVLSYPELKSEIVGSGYILTVYNIPRDKIKRLDARLTKAPNWTSIKNDIKKLIW